MDAPTTTTRATRYRLYPTPEQESRLRAWESSCRWLWNLALGQQLAGMSRHAVRANPPCAKCGKLPHPADGGTAFTCGGCGEPLPYNRPLKGAVDERVFVNTMDVHDKRTDTKAQKSGWQYDLKWLNAADERLADEPSCASQGVLRDLEKAFKRWSKGLAGLPRFKRAGRGNDTTVMVCSAPDAQMRGDAVRFANLGWVKAKIHRPALGKLKTIQIVRDVDQWFAVASFEIEAPVPAPHTGPAVGIDRGVVNVIADSDGRLVKNFNRRSDGVAACGGSGGSRPMRQEAVSRGTDPSNSAPEARPCAGEEPCVCSSSTHFGRARPCAGEEPDSPGLTSRPQPARPCAGEEPYTVTGTTAGPTAPPCAGEEPALHSASQPDGEAPSVVVGWEDRERMSSRIRRVERDIARKVEQAKADGRKPNGSNVRKARERLAKLHRKVRRQRENCLHVESKRYAEQYGTIAVENLNVQAMTASARGTTEKPGSNVRQKAGLNRAILAGGWSKFVSLLKYKSGDRGGRVVEVPAAYSSQTCNGCGHVAADNRETQADFECKACGLVEHADVNAAKVILQRTLAGHVATPNKPKTLWLPKRKRKEPQTAAVPAVEACGGEAPVRAPDEAGMTDCEVGRPQCMDGTSGP